MRVITIILWLSIGLFAEVPPQGAQTHKRITTPVPKLDDAEIDQALRAKLAKSKMARNGFTVKVNNGTATIEGKANIIQHKGAMTRMAKTAGATRVVNNIQISEEAKEKAKAKLASGRRRAQIKRGELRSQTR